MSADFQFLRPLWLAALLPFWLLVWHYLRTRHRGGAWARVCDPGLLPFVLESHAGLRGRHAGWLMCVAGSLAITALAGPVWEHVPVPVFRGDSALVIALDLSSSMNAEDLKPSRLAQAKYKIADILRLRTTGQTALVVFAAQSFVVTPLTDDSATLAAQLQALDTSIMPSQGSAPVTALKRAGELLKQAGVGGGHVLLLTDGADPKALARAGEEAEGAPYRLSVLAVGTTEGAPIPDASGGFAKSEHGDIIMSRLERGELERLAETGRGRYLELATDDGDVRQLLAFLDDDHARDAQKLKELSSSQWREFGPWLLLPLLPLAALAFRRGVLVLVGALLACAGTPQNSRADWWQTPDQAGQSAFRAGDYTAAAQRFQDREWRAAARYRAGDYADAATDLTGSDNATADYNRGNALARLGRLDEAIAAYDEALARTPGDADALYNKRLVEALKQQQQQKPPPAQQQSKQNDKQQNEKQSEPGEQGGENELSGGQKDQEQKQNVSAGNAGGGADGEERQQPQSGDGERQGGERKQMQKPAQAKRDEPKDQDAKSKQLSANDRAASAEEAQATEQWLRQIPDDPAGLLRRKFQYQYKQLYGKQPYDGDPW